MENKIKAAKAQIPAQGIMLQSDYGDSKFYRISCGCGSADHSLVCCVSADADCISVDTYMQVKSNWWSEIWPVSYDEIWPLGTIKYIVNQTAIRTKLIWTLLTKGYVELEATMLMDEQQALNYAETLKKAIKDVKTFSKGK